MKKLIGLIITVLVIGFGVYYFKENVESVNEVTVSKCSHCTYEINGNKVQIDGGVVFINDDKYEGILKVYSKNNILILEKENGIIGYDSKETFNISDGFDSSYPGMKIESIKVSDDKIVIKTTRLTSEHTMDVGKPYEICKNGEINYSGMNELGISVSEPVTLTYEMTYNNGYQSPVITYKQSLASYLKQIVNCKTS